MCKLTEMNRFGMLWTNESKHIKPGEVGQGGGWKVGRARVQSKRLEGWWQNKFKTQSNPSWTKCKSSLFLFFLCV